MPAVLTMPTPFRVGVLVDLYRTSDAGGHVKVWERLAEAATGAPSLDLTVFFLDDAETVTSLSDNVRFLGVPAAVGTKRFRFLKQGAGHTDLASINRRLLPHLAGFDVLHVTSIFAFARTAMRWARRRGVPVVASTHTDVPEFTRVYARDVIANMVGAEPMGRWLENTADISGRMARYLEGRTLRLHKASDRVLTSNDAEARRLAHVLPSHRIGRLRRGIDRDRFSPARRDKEWLTETFGVPADRPLLLFAGRVDESKRISVFVDTVRQLANEGQVVHGVICGAGDAAAGAARSMGADGTVVGPLPQDTLARVMASCDVFVFPSETEVAGNVVVEARASGLPVVVPSGTATAELVAAPGEDGLLVPEQGVAATAAAVGDLLRDPERRRRMGQSARRSIEAGWPTWRDVLDEDLLPAWHTVWAEAREPASG